MDYSISDKQLMKELYFLIGFTVAWSVAVIAVLVLG